jgi:hypothetical protein
MSCRALVLVTSAVTTTLTRGNGVGLISCNAILNGLKHMRRPNVFRSNAALAIPTLGRAILASLMAGALSASAFAQEPAAAPAAEPTKPAETAKPAEPVIVPVATPADAASIPAAVTPVDAGATPATGVAAEAKPAKAKWPWKGSVSFRNLTSITALDRSWEQSYLPSEALGVLISPRYQINDTMSIGMWQYATVELTNTANTTYYREPTLSDTILLFGWTALNTVKPPEDPEDKTPPHGVALSLSGVVGLPTSKASIAKQLYTSLGVGVGARYMWHGLTVGLNTRFSHNFYKTTMAQLQAQPITTCTGDALGCDPSLLSTGVRSPDWRIMAIGSVSYSINDKWGVSVSAGEIMDWLPSLSAANISAIGANGTSLPVGDDQNFRALMYWGAGVDYQIVSWLGAGVGVETYNSQLKLDSTYETPMFNRYTSMYLELNVALDGLPH